MAILLIRHGETALNRARIVQPKETPLSALGVEQAEALGRRLASRPIARILCSDLPRACMTADAVAMHHEAPIQTTPLLRERDFGAVCGTPYSELTVDLFSEDFVPPQGESWAAFRSRASDAFALIARSAVGLSGDLAVVTHGLMCHSLVAGHAALADGVELPVSWSNASLTVLTHDPPYRVELLNCAAHVSAIASL